MKKIITAFFFSFILFSAFNAGVCAAASGKMYVASDLGLIMANLDGTGAVNLGNLGGTAFFPAGVAIDHTNGKIYLIAPRNIIRANLDGTGVENLGTLNGTVNYPMGIALDVAHGKMYVANTRPGTISIANLDGTGGEELYLRYPPMQPRGIALDEAAGKMYVVDYVRRQISRSNLDGSGTEILTLNHHLIRPIGIALDVTAGKMYVADYWKKTIVQANLDGTGAVDLGNMQGNVSSPVGIALDSAAGKMYVTNYDTNTVCRANLDGTGAVNLGSLNGYLYHPFGIALLLPKEITFLSFMPKADIDAALGKFDSKCVFTLGAGSDGISPCTEDVIFQLGDVSLTIPAGSFKKNKKGFFVYHGVVNGVILDIQIRQTGEKSYVFKIEGNGADNLPRTNPVAVKLTIGNDSGSANVNTFSNMGHICQASGKMYVVNSKSHSVSRANIDGTGAVNLGNIGGFLNNPLGIAIDPVHGKMYVTSFTGWSLTMANLDGTGAKNLGNLGGTLKFPTGVAVDSVNNKIYVVSEDAGRGGWGKIIRANLDGTGIENLGTLNGTLNCPEGIALDLAHGKMYVANYYDSGFYGRGSVSVANLDGTGGRRLYLNNTLLNPIGVALDIAAGKMYVANQGNSAIVQANLDGTGVVSFGNLQGNVNAAWGIVLDVAAGKMYVASTNNNTVVRANLDGAGAVNLGNLNGTLDYAAGIALLLPTEVPFSSFMPKSDIDTALGKFDSKSAFILGNGSDGISPCTEDVSFQLGNVSLTIPAGSFKKNKKGFFVYHGVVNSIIMDIQIRQTGEKSYVFKIDGTGADNLPQTNPVTVKITIGNDSGSTTVNADIF